MWVCGGERSPRVAKERATRLLCWDSSSRPFLSLLIQRDTCWGKGTGTAPSLLYFFFFLCLSICRSTLLCVSAAYGFPVQHARHRWNGSFRLKLAPETFLCLCRVNKGPILLCFPSALKCKYPSQMDSLPNQLITKPLPSPSFCSARLVKQTTNPLQKGLGLFVFFSTFQGFHWQLYSSNQIKPTT